MVTRFENGIVITLGKKNRVLWNASVVIDGEFITAVGNSVEMKRQYPDANSIDCRARLFCLVSSVLITIFIPQWHAVCPSRENLPPISYRSSKDCGGK